MRRHRPYRFNGHIKRSPEEIKTRREFNLQNFTEVSHSGFWVSRRYKCNTCGHEMSETTMEQGHVGNELCLEIQAKAKLPKGYIKVSANIGTKLPDDLVAKIVTKLVDSAKNGCWRPVRHVYYTPKWVFEAAQTFKSINRAWTDNPSQRFGQLTLREFVNKMRPL